MSSLIRWLGSSSVHSSTGFNAARVADPDTLALLQESKQVILDVNQIMIEQNKKHRQHGQRLNQELVSLRTAGTQLSDKVRALEGNLWLSDRAKEALRSELAREQQQVSNMAQRMSVQLLEQQRVKGDLAVAKRDREVLRSSVETQKNLLKEQASEIASTTALTGKYGEQTELQQKLRGVQSEIALKSDEIGFRAGILVGVLIGLYSGGIGWILWGLGTGGVVKSVLQKMNIFSCTAALHAQKASLEKQLSLVGGEIKRLARLSQRGVYRS